MEENDNKDELRLIKTEVNLNTSTIINDQCSSNDHVITMRLYDTSSTHWKADGVMNGDINRYPAKIQTHDLIYSNKLKSWICKNNKCKLKIYDQNKLEDLEHATNFYLSDGLFAPCPSTIKESIDLSKVFNS